MKRFIIVAAATIFVGRLLITPRLASVPSAEGAYEALSHLFVGALLFAPMYDWRESVGPARLYGAIGAALSGWELLLFLLQKFAA